MRLSVCIPRCFKQLPLPDAIRKVAELGYDACEMWKFSEEEDLAAASAACQEHGVEFLAICTDYFDCTGGDVEAYVAGIRSAARKARTLGAKMLISQVGKDTGAPAAEQHANIVRCLKAAVPVLEEYDLTVVIEPLNTLINHKDYYLWSSLEGFEILREVDHPRIKMVYDIYHQQVMEGNLIANITENLPLIGHLHSAGCPGRNELNNGEIDYAKIFAAVDAAGYSGACALEYKPLLPPEESLALTRKLY